MRLLWLLLLFPLPAPADYSPLPPKTLVHIGQKPLMLENDRNGTIPEETWNRYIMGRQTNFGLVPWRRGLYGGSNFDNLELYGNLYLGTRNGRAKVPWLMRITIKDECRTPEAVSDLGTDGNFLGWIYDNAAYVAQFASICLDLKTASCKGLVIGTQPLAMGREENLCDEMMQKILEGSEAKVVLDTEWGESWYLRDRACIEKLEASPAVVLDSLAKANWDQKSRQSTYSATNGYGMSSFAILLGALADSEAVDPALLDKLRERLAALDIRLSFQESFTERWIAASGPAAVDAYRRCQAQGRSALFRAEARRFEEALHSPEISKVGYQQEQIRLVTKALRELCL